MTGNFDEFRRPCSREETNARRSLWVRHRVECRSCSMRKEITVLASISKKSKFFVKVCKCWIWNCDKQLCYETKTGSNSSDAFSIPDCSLAKKRKINVTEIALCHGNECYEQGKAAGRIFGALSVFLTIDTDFCFQNKHFVLYVYVNTYHLSRNTWKRLRRADMVFCHAEHEGFQWMIQKFLSTSHMLTDYFWLDNLCLLISFFAMCFHMSM